MRKYALYLDHIIIFSCILLLKSKNFFFITYNPSENFTVVE